MRWWYDIKRTLLGHQYAPGAPSTMSVKVAAAVVLFVFGLIAMFAFEGWAGIVLGAALMLAAGAFGLSDMMEKTEAAQPKDRR